MLTKNRKQNMKNFEVTIGYKAVITIAVKAETDSEAKEKALARIEKFRDKINQTNFTLQDDSYNAHGVLDMDETWNSL